MFTFRRNNGRIPERRKKVATYLFEVKVKNEMGAFGKDIF